MKKTDVILLIILLALVGGFFGVRSSGEPIDVYQSSWQLIRETANQDAADFATEYPLATDKGNFASKNSATVAAGGPFRLKSQRSDLGLRHSFGTRWQFAICGGDAENDTFDYTLVGWAAANGPAQIITEGAGIIGTQDVVLYPDDSATATNIWWADTLSVDTTKWTTAAGAANGASVFNSTDNEIAVLQIYPQGIEWIQFVLYTCDGSTGIQAGDLTVYGRRI